jgi:hypothetical protein
MYTSLKHVFVSNDRMKYYTLTQGEGLKKEPRTLFKLAKQGGRGLKIGTTHTIQAG